MKRDVKAIVVACHTSSAIALPLLRKHFPVPMVGMLYPTARMLAEKYRNDDIIWLATPASVKAEKLEPLARHMGFQGQWYSVACPHWVDCIEAGKTFEVERLLMAWVEQHQVLLQTPNVKILYGCTHYPLIHRILKRYLPGFDCIDPAQAVAEALESMLEQTGMQRQEAKPGVNFLKSVVFSGRMRLLAAEGAG
jgi:glutamate racemase